MDFAHRLANARKHAGLTQQALADRADIHVTQLRRYEAGTTQPPLTCYAPSPSPDQSAQIRSSSPTTNAAPPTPDYASTSKPSTTSTPNEQAAIRTLIEGTLLRHQARRLATS